MPFIAYTKSALRLPLAALMALAFLLASCGGEGAAPLPTKTVRVSKSLPIDGSEASPCCKVDLAVAIVDGGDSVAAKINAAITKMLFDMENHSMEQAADSFASRYVNENTAFLRPFYREDRDDPSKRGWYEYWYKLEASISQPRDGFVACVATREFFEGGAHSIKQKQATNFERATGKPVGLDDVFVPGYRKRLEDKLLSLLKQKAGAADVRSLREKGYLYSSDMYASDNFLLGSDGITFIYNPYEIAPYELGMTELTVDYDYIEDILKK